MYSIEGFKFRDRFVRNLVVGVVLAVGAGAVIQFDLLPTYVYEFKAITGIYFLLAIALMLQCAVNTAYRTTSRKRYLELIQTNAKDDLAIRGPAFEAAVSLSRYQIEEEVCAKMTGLIVPTSVMWCVVGIIETYSTTKYAMITFDIIPLLINLCLIAVMAAMIYASIVEIRYRLS